MFRVAAAILGMMMAGSGSLAQGLLAHLPPGSRAVPLAFAAIDGWRDDDHRAAFDTFLLTCGPVLDGTASLRDALKPTPGLIQACAAARALGGAGLPDAVGARAFFESRFEPREILPATGSGFLTAYFEPEVEASPVRTAAFSVPVLARPGDLVTIPQGERRPGIEPGIAAARATATGLEPYPDRAAIWAGALAEQNLEIAWLRDEAALFIIQVQGSARLRLAGGGRTRLVYAGRNGLPYTSIGRILVERGEVPLAEMSLARLMEWLRADPRRGRALMEQNRSYVFFRRDDSAPPDQGPIGGAGVPLTAGRSLAIDRSIWPYGLPVWISVSPLTPEGPRRALDRLMIAQDTGSAIVGPARGDFFMGAGDDAGARAGLVRDGMRFIILVPKGDLP